MKEVVMMPVHEVVVPPRARQDMGDLDALADSIKRLGLLQPIGINEHNVLIFGERRLRAHMKLGLKEIPASIIDIANLAEGERDENEVRKEFTPSERVAVAKAVEKELGERRGNPQIKKPIPEKIPELKKGSETREIAATKAGFGNAKTYQQAKKVVESGTPELVEAMDKGEVSISAAAAVAELPVEQQREAVTKGTVVEAAKQVRESKGRREGAGFVRGMTVARAGLSRDTPALVRTPHIANEDHESGIPLIRSGGITTPGGDGGPHQRRRRRGRPGPYW